MNNGLLNGIFVCLFLTKTQFGDIILLPTKLALLANLKYRFFSVTKETLCLPLKKSN